MSLAPQVLQKFAESLAERETPLRVQAFESPSNQLLQARTARGTVQVLADRGQWFVELAPPGAAEFFSTTVWLACLSRTEVSLELMPFDAQTAWLEEYLTGGDQREYTIECLLETRRRRAYGRMGLAP
jgi:hypothetical protein